MGPLVESERNPVCDHAHAGRELATLAILVSSIDGLLDEIVAIATQVSRNSQHNAQAKNDIMD